MVLVSSCECSIEVALFIISLVENKKISISWKSMKTSYPIFSFTNKKFLLCFRVLSRPKLDTQNSRLLLFLSDTCNFFRHDKLQSSPLPTVFSAKLRNLPFFLISDLRFLKSNFPLKFGCQQYPCIIKACRVSKIQNKTSDTKRIHEYLSRELQNLHTVFCLAFGFDQGHKNIFHANRFSVDFCFSLIAGLSLPLV